MAKLSDLEPGSIIRQHYERGLREGVPCDCADCNSVVREWLQETVSRLPEREMHD